MTMLSHKIRIYPNQEQKNLIDESCKVQGFIYNWGLNTWQEQYKEGLKPTSFGLKKLFNSIKYEKFDFTTNVSKCCVEGAFMNLQKAFNNFFRTKKGYPKFKKFENKNSFYLSNDNFSIKDFELRIPKCKTKVKCAEKLRFQGKILSGTISKKADKYYVSINLETDVEQIEKTNKYVGLDVGLKDFVVSSDGIKFINPHWLKTKEQRLKRKQKSLARMKKGSNNRKKIKLEIAKLFDNIYNQRKDWQHKISTYVVKSYDGVGIEDLNVKGMLKNHKLAKQISNVGWSEFTRQLKYKADMFKKDVVEIDRWFPSSKTCGVCGCLKEDLTLNDRAWTCDGCGTKHDRDVNASQNILRKAFPYKCGDRLTSVNVVKNIEQVDWMNHKIKCQNNVDFTLLHN